MDVERQGESWREGVGSLFPLKHELRVLFQLLACFAQTIGHQEIRRVWGISKID